MRNKPVDGATFVRAWCEYAPTYGIKKVAEELNMNMRAVYTRVSYLKKKMKIKLPPYQKVHLKKKETALGSFLNGYVERDIAIPQLNKFNLPDDLHGEVVNLAMKVLRYHLENTSK